MISRPNLGCSDVYDVTNQNVTLDRDILFSFFPQVFQVFFGGICRIIFTGISM